LTGRRAFEGESVADALSAILNNDPPEFSVESLPALESIVRQCVEKGVHERFQSACELAFALEAISGHAAAVQPEAPPYRRLTRAIAVLLPVSFIAGAVVTYFSLRQTSAQHRLPVNVHFARIPNEPGPRFFPSLSPDGPSVVYAGQLSG